MSDSKKQTKPQSAAVARTARLRYKTLGRLEATLKLMVERYGSRMTLGEALAIASTMGRLCRVDRVTLAEIADATGLSKQNISRWAQKRMGQSIEVTFNEDDRRIKEIVLIDPRRGQEYVDALALTLGIDPGDRSRNR